MNIDRLLKEEGITTEDLVWNIENGNFDTIRELIPGFTPKDLLEKRFENGNTLMHLIYSSDDSELISEFNEYLISLIKSGDLSPEERRELLDKKNKGGYTPVERFLQEDSVARVYALFKGTSDLELAKEIIKDLRIAIDDAEDEDLEQSKQEILDSATKGIEDYSLWSDSFRFIKSYFIADKKTLLTEKYFSGCYEEVGQLDAIELSSDITSTQLTFTDAAIKCAPQIILIDVPIRTAVTIFLGAPLIYPVVSAAVEFTGCLAKELPVCNEHPIICSGATGALAYSARAAVLGQDVLARALVGIGNKVAYTLVGPVGFNPMVIETVESTIVEVTKKVIDKGGIGEALQAVIQSPEDVLLGLKIGTAVVVCLNVLYIPADEYIKSQNIFGLNATQIVIGGTIEKTDTLADEL